MISGLVFSNHYGEDEPVIHRMSAKTPIVSSGSPILTIKNLAKFGSDDGASASLISGLVENLLTSESRANPSTKVESRDNTVPNNKTVRIPETVPDGIPVENANVI
jgi:hypothetical protein